MKIIQIKNHIKIKIGFLFIKEKLEMFKRYIKIINIFRKFRISRFKLKIYYVNEKIYLIIINIFLHSRKIITYNIIIIFKFVILILLFSI